MAKTLTRKLHQLQAAKAENTFISLAAEILVIQNHFFRFFNCGKPLSNSDIDKLIDFDTNLFRLCVAGRLLAFDLLVIGCWAPFAAGPPGFDADVDGFDVFDLLPDQNCWLKEKEFWTGN